MAEMKRWTTLVLPASIVITENKAKVQPASNPSIFHKWVSDDSPRAMNLTKLLGRPYTAAITTLANLNSRVNIKLMAIRNPKNLPPRDFKILQCHPLVSAVRFVSSIQENMTLDEVGTG